LESFVADSIHSIAELYGRVGFHRRGIGTQLLSWVTEHSGGTLWLYTFSRNLGARAFYEYQGLTIIS
jgi:GNAT superfamily N-acetyltransferase